MEMKFPHWNHFKYNKFTRTLLFSIIEVQDRDTSVLEKITDKPADRWWQKFCTCIEDQYWINISWHDFQAHYSHLHIK
jgi:L-rhamnose mutarotase